MRGSIHWLLCGLVNVQHLNMNVRYILILRMLYQNYSQAKAVTTSSDVDTKIKHMNNQTTDPYNRIKEHLHMS